MKYLILILTTLILFSCDESKVTGKFDFDKTKLLTDYSEKYIIPNYAKFENSFNDYFVKLNNLEINNLQNLDKLKNSFLEAYESLLIIEFLEFGPAQEESFLIFANPFPADTNKILENINLQEVNLYSANNIQAIGFPAIEYLLFSDSLIANKLNYIKIISNELKSKIDRIISKWNSDYKNSFINNNQNNFNSSLTIMINAYIQYYEKNFRDGRFGIPLGIRSNGQTQIHRIEAPYSNQSYQFFKSSFKNIKDFYFNYDNFSLHSVILDRNISIENSTLAQEIKDKFVLIESKILEIGNQDNFKNGLLNNDKKFLELYQEMQKLIGYLKVDMPSVLGIQITYQDNDGD